MLTAGDGRTFTCPASLAGDDPGEDDSFEATVSGEKIVSLAPAANGRAGENRERLKNMFKNR